MNSLPLIKGSLLPEHKVDSDELKMSNDTLASYTSAHHSDRAENRLRLTNS